jgi:hypothetical protein
MSILQRIFGSWKSTLGGSAVGVIAMGIIAAVMSQAGCNFSNVQWVSILAAAFAGPTTVGALTTDNGTKVG